MKPQSKQTIREGKTVSSATNYKFKVKGLKNMSWTKIILWGVGLGLLFLILFTKWHCVTSFKQTVNNQVVLTNEDSFCRLIWK